MSSLGLLLILLIVRLRFYLANIYVMIKLQRIQTDHTSADDQNVYQFRNFFSLLVIPFYQDYSEVLAGG